MICVGCDRGSSTQLATIIIPTNSLISKYAFAIVGLAPNAESGPGKQSDGRGIKPRIKENLQIVQLIVD